jgi:hypothetical protein
LVIGKVFGVEIDRLSVKKYKRRMEGRNTMYRTKKCIRAEKIKMKYNTEDRKRLYQILSVNW